MKIEIKSRFGPKVLSAHDCDGNSVAITLVAAINTGADLRYADLYCADLHGADLEDANLEDANLEDANLEDANLVDAII